MIMVVIADAFKGGGAVLDASQIQPVKASLQTGQMARRNSATRVSARNSIRQPRKPIGFPPEGFA